MQLPDSGVKDSPSFGLNNKEGLNVKFILRWQGCFSEGFQLIGVY